MSRPRRPGTTALPRWIATAGLAVAVAAAPARPVAAWFPWPGLGEHRASPVPARCECEACVPVPSTKKSTKYQYQTKEMTQCYPKARCDLPSHLHHEDPGPREAVAIRRRVLLKRAVAEEKPTTKFEPKKVAVPCVIHRRPHCPACGTP